MTPGRRRTILLFLAAATAGIVLTLVLSNVVSLEQFKERREEIQALIAEQPVARTALFFVVFALAAALAPGAAVFKVVSGALFGLWHGMAVALGATLCAATIGFLLARYLLRRWVERRWAQRFAIINRGVEREGVIYLLALRFNPLVPFFLINFGMGMTRMRLWVFVVTSFFGLIPASFVYANAGTELARIQSPSDILSFRLLASLLLLSVMPLIGRWAAVRLRRWRGAAADPVEP
jgi:uncharacterized membrane protein YdjX (TVP38/TMEM64 family)